MQQEEVIIQAKQLEDFFQKTVTVLSEMRAIIVKQNSLLIDYKNRYNALVSQISQREEKDCNKKKIHH